MWLRRGRDWLIEMGFVLSILYFVLSYFTPYFVFGSFAQYRIEVFLAALLLAISIPKMRSFVFRTPQAPALVGLAAVTFLSILFSDNWLGGSVIAMNAVVPGLFAYFLVVLYCNSRKKLNVLVLMLLVVCLFIIVEGAIDLRHGVPAGGPPISAATGAINTNLWNFEHPYLLAMQNDAGQWIYRLKGMGEINDPNDFGQLLVCEIPLLFLLWRPKKIFLNLAVVIVPVCLLLYGIYLTKSRGALLGLVVVIAVAARRRVGTVLGFIIAGGLFAGAIALQFTGGRAISASSGSDRTELWGEGLQLLKEHPLFGVGFSQMGDYTGLTAHNSIVVCAAELGLFGLFFWSLYLFPTVRDMLVIASKEKVKEAEHTESADIPGPIRPWTGTAVDKLETNRVGFCLLLSLIGYLATGWFLSRAFVMTFFILGGMAEVVYEAARSQGMVTSRLPLPRVLFYSAVLTISLVALVWVNLRIANFSH